MLLHLRSNYGGVYVCWSPSNTQNEKREVWLVGNFEKWREKKGREGGKCSETFGELQS